LGKRDSRGSRNRQGSFLRGLLVIGKEGDTNNGSEGTGRGHHHDVLVVVLNVGFVALIRVDSHGGTYWELTDVRGSRTIAQIHGDRRRGARFDLR